MAGGMAVVAFKMWRCGDGGYGFSYGAGSTSGSDPFATPVPQRPQIASVGPAIAPAIHALLLSELDRCWRGRH